MSLEELRQDLRNKKVDGILVDSYVSDSRRELFSDFSIKQVIDLQSSYGVVMGADAMKIRKCIYKYWKENAAMRANYIKENVKPVEVGCGLKRQSKGHILVLYIFSTFKRFCLNLCSLLDYTLKQNFQVKYVHSLVILTR